MIYFVLKTLCTTVFMITVFIFGLYLRLKYDSVFRNNKIQKRKTQKEIKPFSALSKYQNPCQEQNNPIRPDFFNIFLYKIFYMCKENPVFLYRLEQNIVYNLKKSSKMLSSVKVKDLWVTEDLGIFIDSIRILSKEEIRDKSFTKIEKIPKEIEYPFYDSKISQETSNKNKSVPLSQASASYHRSEVKNLDQTPGTVEKIQSSQAKAEYQDHDSSKSHFSFEKSATSYDQRSGDQDIEAKIRTSFHDILAKTMTDTFQEHLPNADPIWHDFIDLPVDKMKKLNDCHENTTTDLDRDPIYILIHFNCPASINMILNFSLFVNVELKMSVGNFHGPMVIILPYGYKMGLTFLNSLKYDLTVETVIKKKKKDNSSKETFSNTELLKQELLKHSDRNSITKKNTSINNIVKRVIRFNAKKKGFYPNYQMRPIAQLLPSMKTVDLYMPDFSIGYYIDDINLKKNTVFSKIQKLFDLQNFVDFDIKKQQFTIEMREFTSVLLKIFNHLLDMTFYFDGTIWSNFIYYQMMVIHAIELRPIEDRIKKSSYTRSNGMHLYRITFSMTDIIDEITCRNEILNQFQTLNIKKPEEKKVIKVPYPSNTKTSQSNSIRNDSVISNTIRSNSTNIEPKSMNENIFNQKSSAELPSEDDFEDISTKSTETVSLHTNNETEIEIDIGHEFSQNQNIKKSEESYKGNLPNKSRVNLVSKKYKFGQVSQNNILAKLQEYFTDMMFFKVFPDAKIVSEIYISNKLTKLHIVSNNFVNEWIRYTETEFSSKILSFWLNLKTQEFFSLQIISNCTDAHQTSFYDSDVHLNFLLNNPKPLKILQHIRNSFLDMICAPSDQTDASSETRQDFVSVLQNFIDQLRSSKSSESKIDFERISICSNQAQHLRSAKILCKSIHPNAHILDENKINQFLTKLEIQVNEMTYDGFFLESDNYLMFIKSNDKFFHNLRTPGFIFANICKENSYLLYSLDLKRHINDALLPMICFKSTIQPEIPEKLKISGYYDPVHTYDRLSIIKEMNSLQEKSDRFTRHIGIKSKVFSFNFETTSVLKFIISTNTPDQINLNLEYSVENKPMNNEMVISTEEQAEILVKCCGKLILTVNPSSGQEYTILSEIFSDNKIEYEKMIENVLMNEDQVKKMTTTRVVKNQDFSTSYSQISQQSSITKHEKATVELTPKFEQTISALDLQKMDLRRSYGNLFLIDAIFEVSNSKNRLFFPCNPKNKIFWNISTVSESIDPEFTLSHTQATVSLNCFGILQCEKDLYRFEMKSQEKTKVRVFVGQVYDQK
ncbi:hypothetical protein M153_3100018060 [Pseudoloma neurophilia]|uniref:Uncharacterized protein n=1 Tax=Pseudoloma neurophilia TaxID=146866 RepID=A0A0R0M0Q8_9MICR|nr:hypothetical protein M153_3100018060 [Pseudoloma neurophilia]